MSRATEQARKYAHDQWWSCDDANLGEQATSVEDFLAGARFVLERAREKVEFHHVPYAENDGTYALVRLDEIEKLFMEQSK